jgi:hypothetical protein
MPQADDTFSTADTIAPAGQRLRIDLTQPLPVEATSGGDPRKRSTLSDPTGMTAFGSDGLNAGRAAPRLEAHYYAQWRAEVAAAEARGEDYYADFERRARERSDQDVARKLVNSIKGAFGRKKKKKGPEPEPGQGQGEERAAARSDDDGVVR